MRRVALIAMLTCTLVAVAAVPAIACGGLVGENGTIRWPARRRSPRITTASSATSPFQFTGEGQEVGSIVPLPGGADDGRARRRLDPATARTGGRDRRSRRTERLQAESAGDPTSR